MIRDRLASLVSGLGGPKDKAAGVRHAFCALSPAELLAAYRGDWIARKVIDVPATDMVRAGRTWRADAADAAAIEAEERRLGLRARLLQALKASRLFGGAALVLGVPDGDPATPLELDRVGLRGLAWVHVCGRFELAAGPLDRDPLSPGWGRPLWWELDRVIAPPAQAAPSGSTARAGSGRVRVHPSRVIAFVGAALPDPVMFEAGAGAGWGDSVLQAVQDAVLHAGIAASGIASLVMEAKVDVYSIPNLSQNVGDADYRARMLERFGLANTGKSLQNALLLDAGETWQQKTVNFGALPEILTLYLEIAAAAADIPVTRMLARQSKGLANGGEADLKTYYDRIAADQETTLRPALEALDEVLIRSALGARPPGVSFAFAPLYTPSDVERAAVRKSDAETAAAWAAAGLIPRAALAAAVQGELARGGAGYSGLDAALAALGPAPGGGARTGLGAAELTALVAAAQAGALDPVTLQQALRRDGLIDA